MIDILNGLDWHVEKADCIEHLATLPDESVSFSVFSPPFPSVYAYSSSHADIGNSEDLRGDARLHLSFFYRQLFRALKPGRSAVVHVAQIVKMKRAGEMGLFDFRGLNIRLAERVGFSYEYDWCVRKNPQSQALRNKAWELKFQGLETDRAGSRGTLPDFLLKFRKPGDNAVKISNKEITRNDWIKWAEHCWDDIQETDTLNVAEGRGEDDTKHICPLQLEPIRRLVLLFSNPGEIVLSPFAGIGSEGFMSLGGKSPKTGKRIIEPRRFYGIELKDEYYDAALLNCQRAVEQHRECQRDLFTEVA